MDLLPDVALLKIFDFYVEARTDVWYTLVQVCRKWRSVAFGSPRRLNLQLHCGARTPVRETVDVWPPLPIVVRSSGHEAPVVDNLVAALEYNDRISEINLYNMSSSQFERVSRAMHQPFPALEHLNLGFNEETALVDPASFLGGSAPRLRSLVTHFRGCRNFFYLPRTSFISIFGLFLIPGTFHLRQWPLASPY
jgi:hypothetical protein